MLLLREYSGNSIGSPSQLVVLLITDKPVTKEADEPKDGRCMQPESDAAVFSPQEKKLGRISYLSQKKSASRKNMASSTIKRGRGSSGLENASASRSGFI